MTDAAYDVELLRKDFPILERRVHDNQPLIYLDSANTSQKPRQVLDALTEFYEQHNSNIHRATHALGEEATEAYEGARMKVAAFIGAASPDEVVFTKHSSEAPNIVPWQLLCQRTGATLRWFGVTDDGRLDVSNIDDLINPRTKVVSFVHISNILGTLNPVQILAERAHAVGALVVLDASPSVPHLPVDVQALGVDLVAFTGHKMCGPTGIGVLWGRRDPVSYTH